MATVAPPPAEQAADLLQKLSLDSQAKTMDIPEPKKQYGAIDSSNAANSQISSDRFAFPSAQEFTDSSMCYVPNAYSSTYIYGGFDPRGHDWDEYSRYLNPDGVDMTSGVYGDSGSVIYHPGYGYTPYGSYSPAGSPLPTMGNDSQLYGPQHYQYPPYFQPLTSTSARFAPSPAAAPQGDVLTSVATDQKPPVDTANTNSNGVGNGGSMKGNNGTASVKPTYQNKSFDSSGSYGGNALPGRTPSGNHDPRYSFAGLGSPITWLDSPLYSDGQSRPMNGSTISSSISSGNNYPLRNLNYRPNSHFMGLHHPRPVSGISSTQGFINRMYPNKLYSQYRHAVRSSVGYGSHGYDSPTNGRSWLAFDSKYKPRGRTGGYYGYGNENADGSNELNRGPRAKGLKNQRGFPPTVPAVKVQNHQSNAITDTEKDKIAVAPDCNQYNKTDFPEVFPDSRFFIIKSYSEDDVHKSIKYNVWASTPNGNKKLDAAYHEAQEKPGSCPIFLFFSVNTSGQFVGLAEMVGPVDFHKNLEYWQQDKWNGCFPVKWHMVKDVPNSLLKHITLENNENKPVTNSRDTQEVKLEPGLKMVQIFKDHTSKTCILDDFGFYEARQKSIQEKKAKQQQFLKQTTHANLVWEGKCGDVKKEGACVEVKTPNSLEVVRNVSKDKLANEKHLSDDGSDVKIGDAPKGVKPVVF